MPRMPCQLEISLRTFPCILMQITDTEEGRVYVATAAVTPLGMDQPIMCAFAPAFNLPTISSPCLSPWKCFGIQTIFHYLFFNNCMQHMVASLVLIRVPCQQGMQLTCFFPTVPKIDVWTACSL